MRSNLKIFGAEVLYLLASTIVAGLAALLQTVGRSYEGDYSSFIWSGKKKGVDLGNDIEGMKSEFFDVW